MTPPTPARMKNQGLFVPPFPNLSTPSTPTTKIEIEEGSPAHRQSMRNQQKLGMVSHHKMSLITIFGHKY